MDNSMIQGTYAWMLYIKFVEVLRIDSLLIEAHRGEKRYDQKGFSLFSLEECATGTTRHP